MTLSRIWALHAFLVVSSAAFAEPTPPCNAVVWEHTQTLKEIQRWKHAQTEALRAVLMRRLDDLAEDEDAPAQAVVRRVRETVKAGRSPVLSESRGGPALLQQAIVNDMEDRHAVETEATARIENVHRKLQAAFKDLAEGYDANGDSAGAQSVRAEAVTWDLARVRSTALTLAVQPPESAPVRKTEDAVRSGADPTTPGDAPAGNELRIQSLASGPSLLSLRQPLRISIFYRHAQPGRAVIRARPYFRDGIAEAFSASRTIFGEGNGSVTLEIGSRTPAKLETVLLQMINPEDGSILAEVQTRLEATWQ